MNRRFTGKSAEHLLISELTKKGLDVSVPVVDGAYDMIVDNGNSLKKVQVKSTQTQSKHGSYQCLVARTNNAKGERKSYRSSEVDIVAVYIQPDKVWYFIPVSLINVKNIHLYPKLKKGKFDIYEDYWKIFDL